MGLELNETLFAVGTQTAGGLPGTSANTILDYFCITVDCLESLILLIARVIRDLYSPTLGKKLLYLFQLRPHNYLMADHGSHSPFRKIPLDIATNSVKVITFIYE